MPVKIRLVLTGVLHATDIVTWAYLCLFSTDFEVCIDMNTIMLQMRLERHKTQLRLVQYWTNLFLGELL